MSQRSLTNGLLPACFGALCGLLALVAIARPVFADDPSDKKEPEQNKKSRFIRVVFDETDRPTVLQTATKRYVSSDEQNAGVVVDLIGAVHVGDLSYYERLNKDFTTYDALLYELIAPDGAKPTNRESGNRSVLSGLQNTMKDVLQLEFQLDKIDYTPENFVHADMSPEQFVKTMRTRGETPMTMFLRLFKASAAQQRERPAPQVSAIQLLGALLDPENGALFLKRIVAAELSEADTFLEAVNGEQGSTIITERNKVALDVLREQMEMGKKRVGIFYGSGHMRDFEERLIADFGLKLDSVRWYDAWDLKDKKPAPKKQRKPSSRKKLKKDA